jgi:hypothetical protein
MFHMCPQFSHHVLCMHAWLVRWNGHVGGVFGQQCPLMRCLSHPTTRWLLRFH